MCVFVFVCVCVCSAILCEKFTLCASLYTRNMAPSNPARPPKSSNGLRFLAVAVCITLALAGTWLFYVNSNQKVSIAEDCKAAHTSTTHTLSFPACCHQNTNSTRACASTSTSTPPPVPCPSCTPCPPLLTATCEPCSTAPPALPAPPPGTVAAPSTPTWENTDTEFAGLEAGPGTPGDVGTSVEHVCVIVRTFVGEFDRVCACVDERRWH